MYPDTNTGAMIEWAWGVSRERREESVQHQPHDVDYVDYTATAVAV
jgi:hypothetical protein